MGRVVDDEVRDGRGRTHPVESRGSPMHAPSAFETEVESVRQAFQDLSEFASRHRRNCPPGYVTHLEQLQRQTMTIIENEALS